MSSELAPFFQSAKPQIFRNAKELRHRMTEAEKVMWENLRNHKMMGMHFRNQHPVGMYIVDFYCHKVKLVIEVDGGIHNQKDVFEYDREREKDLEEFGLKVIRFTNDEVLSDIDNVKQRIENEINRIINENNRSFLPDL